MTTTTIEINPDAKVNIRTARRGSDWVFPLTFGGLDDGDDFSAVTDVVCVLKRLPGGDRTAPSLTMTADLSQKASLVITLTATAVQTALLEAGSYLWELQFVASGAWCDRWAPMNGEWVVRERQAR